MDDLVVVDKATWSNGNDYSVGQTISGVSATFTGGSDQTIYRSRTQHRAKSTDAWINSPWTSHGNTPQVIQLVLLFLLVKRMVRYDSRHKLGMKV